MIFLFLPKQEGGGEICEECLFENIWYMKTTLLSQHYETVHSECATKTFSKTNSNLMQTKKSSLRLKFITAEGNGACMLQCKLVSVRQSRYFMREGGLECNQQAILLFEQDYNLSDKTNINRQL